MMNLKRCKEGHYYDADKYTTCPHCNPTMSALDATIALKVGDFSDYGDFADTPKKVSEAEDNNTLSLEEAIKEAQSPLDDEELTVSFYKETLGTEPVVGWLTCIDGGHYGKSFGLRSGRNFIGRDPGNDVALTGDSSVSRERHAIVTYDPRAKCFIAQPGDSRELFCLNEKVLLTNEILKPYDIISIGNEKLLFIPMCGEKFCWEETRQRREEVMRTAS